MLSHGAGTVSCRRLKDRPPDRRLAFIFSSFRVIPASMTASSTTTSAAASSAPAIILVAESLRRLFAKCIRVFLVYFFTHGAPTTTSTAGLSGPRLRKRVEESTIVTAVVVLLVIIIIVVLLASICSRFVLFRGFTICYFLLFKSS